jgi:hypothetical protein
VRRAFISGSSVLVVLALLQHRRNVTTRCVDVPIRRSRQFRSRNVDCYSTARPFLNGDSSTKTIQSERRLSDISMSSTSGKTEKEIINFHSHSVVIKIFHRLGDSHPASVVIFYESSC